MKKFSWKEMMKSRRVKISSLSFLLLLSIASSHVIFSKKTVFENDIPQNKNLIKTNSHNNLDRFKIAVVDNNVNKIISISDFRISNNNYKMLTASSPTKISYSGLSCNVAPIGNYSYKMKCYNLGPENKGFGMYFSNSYTVSSYIDDNGVIIEDIQRKSYRETFLLAYLFGFMFWTLVFFWPIVFSYKTTEEDVITTSKEIVSYQ